jgi:hypothetical protein
MQTRGLNVKVGLAVFGMLLGSHAWLQIPAYAQFGQEEPRTIFENVTLSPGFSPNPTTVHGISGGPQVASEVSRRAETATGACAGYIDRTPDHVMVLTEFFDYLQLHVQSPEDTTLVIRGPGGSWCNDNYEDKNPGIAGQWLSGTYQIWVGSHESDRYDPYIIRITTR